MSMTATAFPWLFATACTGFGLLLIGGGNLLVMRRGWALRAAVTLAGLAAGVAAAAALDLPAAPQVTALWLLAGLALTVVLSSRSLIARLVAGLQTLHRPGVRYGLLAVVGMGLVVGAAGLFAQADQADQAVTLAEFDLIHGRPQTVPSQRGRAFTDRGTPIVLKEAVDDEDDDVADARGCEGKLLRDPTLAGMVIRRGPGDEASNCHGWVFTGGRFVLDGQDVARILADNGYALVEVPTPGDLVIYRHQGLIAHTAVVRYVTPGQPILVEGKWGRLGVFLHPAEHSLYGTDFAFYHSPRQGHLLAETEPPAGQP
jgi:hypothetical protein